MDCEACRGLLSELIDRNLDPAAGGALRGHLDGCAPCREELRLLKKTLGTFRSTPPEAPPEGLAAAISAQVAALGTEALPARRAANITPSTLRRGATSRGFLPWFIAAAALLVVALALFLYRHEEDWLKDREKILTENRSLRDERKALRADLAKAQGDLMAGRDRLHKDLEAAKGLLERTHAASEEALRERTGEMESLSKKATQLQDTSRLQAGRIAALQERLTDSEAESGRFRQELAALVKTLEAEKRGPAVAAIGQPSPLEDPDDIASAAQEPQVIFRRTGESMELELKGPREKVIPELLRIAWSEDDPDAADLALSTLESLVGEESPSAGTAAALGTANGRATDTFLGWCGRRLDILAERTGLADPPRPIGKVPGGDGASRTARLRRIEERWTRLSGSATADIRGRTE